MQYWLMKSEPETYSIDNLKKDKKVDWDGVRNYQARNYMRDLMKKGDSIFFYHSNVKVPGIMGIATVSKESHPDSTQFDSKSEYYDPKARKENPRWHLVEIKYQSHLSREISLEELRKYEKKELKGFPLLNKGNRLSIIPLLKEHWNFIYKLSKKGNHS